MKLQLFALIFCSALSLSAQGTPSIEKLGWMSGNWTTTQSDTTIEEHWTQPTAGTMIGMGRTITGGKTVFFEYLRIEMRGTDLFYIAHPKARPGTDFKAIRITENEVVFENPQHDFPKRVIYRRNPDGNITARAEGDNEKPKLSNTTA